MKTAFQVIFYFGVPSSRLYNNSQKKDKKGFQMHENCQEIYNQVPVAPVLADGVEPAFGVLPVGPFLSKS